MLKKLIIAVILLGPKIAPAQDAASLQRAQRLMALAESKAESAEAELLKALSDPDWYVRGRASIALAKLKGKEATAKLISLLEDPSWFVRDAAIEAIASAGDPAAAGRLLELLRSPDPYCRARAASALARLSPDAASSIASLLTDQDEHVRRTAALALGQLKYAAATEDLIKLLKDESPAVRVAAARALGRIGDARAKSPIEAALAESGEDGWEYAAALCRLGDKSHSDLIAAALKSEYASTALAALEALAELADEASLPAIIEFARSPLPKRSAKFRLEVARALANFNSEQSRAMLAELLRDDDERVRSQAAKSLASTLKRNPKIGRDKEIAAALIAQLTKESSPDVSDSLLEVIALIPRDSAVEALLQGAAGASGPNPKLSRALEAAGLTTDKLARELDSGRATERLRAVELLGLFQPVLGDRATELLRKLLAGSADPEVKAAAAVALGRSRDRQSVESLIAALKAKAPQLRLAAARALGQIGDFSASEALLEATRDEEAAVRQAALDALKGLGISVERLSEDLSSTNPEARLSAIWMMARLGEMRAMPHLTSALEDKDPRVRAAAARALAQFPPDAATIKSLIKALEDPEAEVRLSAALALGGLGDRAAILPLAARLSDRDQRVSQAAAESLARLGDQRATKLLTDSLKDPDWRVRARAAAALAGAPAADSAEIMAALAQALNDKDPVVRFYAKEALVARGAASVPYLIQVLRAGRESAREGAARALARIGPPSVPELIAILKDKASAPELKVACAWALGQIRDARAIEPLVALLKEERYFIRREAGRALSRIGEPALTELLELAQSASAPVREAAVEALGSANSPRAVDALIQAIADSNQNVSRAAVRALGETKSERAVGPLLSLLASESLGTLASEALSELGQPAVPGLIAALKDARPTVRALAARALGEIASREAVPALIELANGDSGNPRAEAIEALSKIGDPAALNAISRAMHNGSVITRRKAIRALARMRDPKVIDMLTAALEDRDAEVRQEAAYGLGEIGDERALGPLEAAAENDPNPDVRSAAQAAIAQIQARHKTR